MIGRRLGWGMVVLTVVVAPTGWAWGQDLGDNIRSASNVAPFQNQIQAFVTDQVSKLGGSDPLAQRAAREALIRQVAPLSGGGQLSAAFLAAYAGLVNDELMKLSASADARVRLNAAIVAARVAEGAKNAKLQPLTMALLQDPSDAVVWWTLRAARSVLPHAIAAGGNDPMVAAIVQLGQTRPGVIQTVYEALSIEQSLMPAGASSRVWSAVIPALHTILQSRIDQYKTGLAREPSAEIRATLYLTARQEYQDGQSLTQKVATVQKISDLIGVAGQRAGDLTAEQRQDLVIMLRGVGGALFVVGQWEGSSAIQNVARPLSQLPRNASAQDIQSATKPVYNGLITWPKFAKLTPPPKIGEMREGATTHGSGAAPAPQGVAAEMPR